MKRKSNTKISRLSIIGAIAIIALAVIIIEKLGKNIYWIIGIIVAIVVLRFVLKVPKVKGFLGEIKVRLIISRGKKADRYVLNNYMLIEDGRSTQIDHILINLYGVFVIETKNISGRIYGKHEDHNWTQVLAYWKTKHTLYSPVKQNATHAYRVAHLLPEGTPIYSVVVLVQNNDQYVNSPDVVAVKNLKGYLKSKPTSISYEQMSKYYETLLLNRAKTSNLEHKKHVKSKSYRINSRVCVRCGGKLIEHNGEFGHFIGCENYPDCKYIKHIL